MCGNLEGLLALSHSTLLRKGVKSTTPAMDDTSRPEGKTGHINLGATDNDNNSVYQGPPDGRKLDITCDIQEPSLPKRQQWTNQREFLLSCIAMVVGFGNIWRFPFVAYENGGGAFLIPYILVLIFIGRPVLYMEYILGQFASCGHIKIWELSPAFRGVGYAQAISTWINQTYYVILMAFCIYFFIGSFNSVLPWAVCGSWSSENCFDANTSFHNLSPLPTIRVSSAEEYFKNEILKDDPEGFNNGIGFPDWRLALCLLFSWIVLFCVQVKGIKSSGKVSYITSIFPYAILLIMFIRGVTLPGSLKGILFFITPKWNKLLELKVWHAAVGQALFSLAVGAGHCMMFTSYNPFHHNIYRDATIVSVMDTFTSVFAGLTVFSTLGHLSELLEVEIQDVIRSGGSSLAFISYPDVLARFDYVPQLFSCLFFLMLFIIGVGSVSGGNQVLITIVCDAYPKAEYWKVAAIHCLLTFFVGLIYATPQGQIILTLVNHYGVVIPIVLLLALEFIGVTWVYGIRNFMEDIEFMLTRKIGLFWKICWTLFIPIFLVVIFVYDQLVAKRLSYGSYAFGDALTYTGIAMSAVICLMAPVFFFVELILRWHGDLSIWCNVKNLFKPTSKWGPRDPKLKEEYRQFKINIRASRVGAAN